MLSAANQRSLSKVCCLLRICGSLPKLSCLRQISTRYWNYVILYSEWAFAVEMVLSAANQCPLLKVYCLQRISIGCRKCVLQQIYDSLPKSSCLQRISIRCRDFVGCSELAFAVEVELFCSESSFAAESALIVAKLPKLSCLQRINIHWWKCVGYSKVAFAAEIKVSAAKQFPLPNCVACSESVFTVELCGKQRTSFRCWFSTIDSPVINDLNACNNFIVWRCKMWNTWM